MSDMEQPSTVLVFIEGMGFGGLSAAGIIALHYPAWPAVAVVAAMLILLTFSRNSRAIGTDTTQDGGSDA